MFEEDVKGVVEAVSDFAAGVVPGMYLHYREFRVESSWREFDSYHSEILLKAPGIDLCVLHSAYVPLGDNSAGPPAFNARLKLMKKFAEDGWPLAESEAEMKLKLAAGGVPMFGRICERYARGGYQRVGDFYNFCGIIEK